MNISIKESFNEKLIRKYDITVSADDIQKIKQDKLVNIAKQTTLPGFRKGHAPLHIIESKHGQTIITDVLNEAIQKATKQLYQDNKLESVAEPTVSITKFVDGQDLELNIELEVYPEIPEIDFKKIKLKRNVIKITDKEINESLEQIASYNKKFEDVVENRDIKSGDMAIINFKGFINDEEFKGGSGENYSLEIGSNSFIPGFEDQLIGKKVGETVDVNVAFPEDYHEKSLAGSPALFKVEILKLQSSVKPEINDELAKSIKVESLEVLKEDIRKKYEKQVKQLEKGNLKKALMDELAKITNFDLPEKLLKIETDTLWTNFIKFKEHIKAHNETSENNLHEHSKEDMELCEKSDEEVKAIHLDQAKKRITLGLILNSVFRKNSLKVTDEDMQDIIESEALMYGANVDMMKQYYLNNKEAMQSLQSRAMESSIMSFILDKVSYKDKELTFDEYTKSL